MNCELCSSRFFCVVTCSCVESRAGIHAHHACHEVHAKNTATAKDMMGCFVLWSREIDVESFRLSEQQVIVQNERLFSEILEKTVRPGQKEVQQGLSMAYQIGVDEAKAISKSICNAFKFARSKIQSCSSKRKLEPAVWKFVQRLKTLSASSSSPSSRRSLDLEGSQPSVEEEVALKRKLEFGAPSKTEDEILAIYAAGSANAKSMDANVAMTGSSRDAISISESPSVVESSSETEAFQKKPGTAKPYFDPAEGCYIRLAEEGKVSRGVLEKGPAGFCLVRFEDEEPFPSEVPNLWLAPQAAESGPKLKRVRATGKGKGKGKGKSTKGSVAASAPERAAADFEGNPGQLALCRAAQQSLFLLRLPQLPRRFCLECMTSLVCLWKHSLQRAARGSIRTQ